MACLPESENDRLSNPATNMTPSPPPPTPPTSSTAIYARVNPNLKRDKTNNNNFTSTFSSSAQPTPPQPILVNSTSAITDYQKLGKSKESKDFPWIV